MRLESGKLIALGLLLAAGVFLIRISLLSILESDFYVSRAAMNSAKAITLPGNWGKNYF